MMKYLFVKNFILRTVLLLTLSAQLLAQGSIGRTPWEMNRGAGWSYLNFSLQSHGYPGNWNGSEYDETSGAYANAAIPATGNSGWGPAPNGETIGFVEASILPGNCLSSVDYTYFQTLVNVPTNTNVTQFTIEFSSIDDGGRVTVFNSTYPNGIVIPGSYVTLANGGTADLATYIVEGQNRVVVTQVDDCPTGNNLHSATVVLNGETVEVCDATVQTFTLLGSSGTVGSIDPYTEASTDGGQTWGPAYLTGTHPWGYAVGTNSWVSWNPDKHAGVGTGPYGSGPYEDRPGWNFFDFRIRFILPDDFADASMLFDLKADNYAKVWVNSTFIAEDENQFSFTADAATINQALVPGLNEVRIRLGDWGGDVGINYRIDVTVSSCEVIDDPIVVVEVPNTAPMADAGADQTVNCVVGNTDVSLSGSNSADSDGDALTYSWSLAGSEVATTESFTPNLSAGTYEYTLTVSDGQETDSDVVSVTIVADTEAPVLTLLGTGPFSVNIHNAYTDAGYETSDACGSEVIVESVGTVDVETPGSYTLTFTATDEAGNAVIAERVVTVINAVPVAIAGDNQSFECVVGEVDMTIDGSSSSDADGDALTYSWSLDGSIVGTSALYSAVSGHFKIGRLWALQNRPPQRVQFSSS